ncbi:hypothetical protein WOLCODRAFT_161881 [Wolfiporia cocos MD-104 SS10]|uniref:Uncharacterized protein n=1 Tax=Wolfiporia cocos (strain MD-104) TaxID=742152 RepID=A0A2H3JC85_WOLCO|nr:hypothetical protein WOLCODRAFT_161881 [Wolfiporia cocos MD-104 SS10]
MYLTDGASDTASYRSRYSMYGSLQRPMQRPPTPSSVSALDTNFDAMTTEAPTDWGSGVDRRQGNGYEESVSGYQNYVKEMERKILVEDGYEPSDAQPSASSVRQPTQNAYRSERSGGSRVEGSRRSVSRAETPLNARIVSGRQGRMELVEHSVREEGPNRTISMWRERVADSSSGSDGNEDGSRNASDSNASQRRVASDNSRLRRRAMTIGPGSLKGSGSGVSVPARGGKVSWERSEYMVAYQPSPRGGFPQPLYAQSENGHMVPFPTATHEPEPAGLRSPQTMPHAPMSPIASSRRRSSVRSSLGRSEYLITPPRSGGSSGSSPSPKLFTQRQLSPVNRRSSNLAETAAPSKVMLNSHVDLILASCDPPLNHLKPILFELGIERLEHLRAIAKLSEETRDREIKEEALRMGMTIVEWAILLDKIHSL